MVGRYGSSYGCQNCVTQPFLRQAHPLDTSDLNTGNKILEPTSGGHSRGGALKKVGSPPFRGPEPKEFHG